MSSKNPHFQNEAKGTTFLVKMSFICMWMKNHFLMKGYVLNLICRGLVNVEIVYCQQFSIADLFFLLSFIDLFNSIDRTIFYVNFKKLVTS